MNIAEIINPSSLVQKNGGRVHATVPMACGVMGESGEIVMVWKDS